MHRIIAVFLLLLHINTSMFIPVVDEVDMIDACGMQVDDINSAYEYVDEVVLGNEDNTPEDEDDDEAHFFNTLSIVKIFITPPAILAASEPAPAVCWQEKPDFVLAPENRWASVAHEIVSPPPKA